MPIPKNRPMHVEEEVSSQTNTEILLFALVIILSVIFINFFFFYLCRCCVYFYHTLENQEGDDERPLIQHHMVNRSTGSLSPSVDRLGNVLGYDIPSRRRRSVVSKEALSCISLEIPYIKWLKKRKGHAKGESTFLDNRSENQSVIVQGQGETPSVIITYDVRRPNLGSTSFVEMSSALSNIYNTDASDGDSSDDSCLLEDEEDFCIICYADYAFDDILRVLPCEHVFHTQCIDTWMTTMKASCPLCNEDYYKYFLQMDAASSVTHENAAWSIPLSPGDSRTHSAETDRSLLSAMSVRNSRMPYIVSSTL
ncbi:ubiquitin-protein ligase E3 Meu34, human ZNRF3 homolog [Schizosaccharomyces pombe]|uniref:RING finger protein mug145 n=1 Tax=Schizosaccharomyces pombe (strain 972 / ATCC 24843) TaxID=284812 RepID=MU145_SCHPO|nr:putative ubiquitin-protein ligase E3 Meu34 [Schizosaccharomyces pombe]P87119.1 RecName: Full=RING finger protein mug145; AltName: Full=Meiotic expression up-regulated protein 34; AltName: Full=Meiotically up-regulated gene 145 protein [Schizosaccharomyces pombe 972h-]BAE46410.1 meiotic expression upregulated 34 [Schizosaccharomyces pombe]CAB08748.1 ubiquitin-protein ligase E3 Meu34 (predicted) [Schizosaccharomyces pombe]|eukprot:NP_593329.1 putative ubiquitin-protein ligase E3 Meu34 [Schizosaccharomyces pombe]